MRAITILTLIVAGNVWAQSGDTTPPEVPETAPESEPENPYEANEASLRAGEQVYVRLCVTCHGLDGKGETDMVADLPVKPRDFTKGEFLYGDTDAALFKVIQEGTEHGMEAFRDRVSKSRTWHLVNYVKSLGPDADEALPEREVPKNPIVADAASLRRGQQYYRRFCVKCHGMNGKGDTEMREFLSTHPSDLTNGEWKYGGRDGDIFFIIKEGTEYDMESFKAQLTDENIWHVVNYLKSIVEKSE